LSFPSRSVPYRPSVPDNRAAFTLLELLVVLVLVSIMMAVAAPRLRSTIITDPLKRSARQVVGVVNEARQQAAASPKGCGLVIAVEEGTFALSCPQSRRRTAAAAEEDAFGGDELVDADLAPEPAPLLRIAEPARIRSVWNGASERITSGEVSLWISADGVMEPSVINLSDGSDELGLSISPFLGAIRISDEAAVPENYDGSEALL
jgi:prepilin-type N-terminal cleavage/methylation domain-containing protein